MEGRNSYIITQALNHYLRGSVFIAISGHLVTTTDAIVVSWMLGHEALSAVNIVIPIITLISSLMILLGVGGAISVANAMGEGNNQKMSVSFTSSVLAAVFTGIIVAVLSYIFCNNIVDFLIHKDLIEKNYAFRYLQAFCYAMPLLIVAGVLEHIIRTDGGTKLVRIAVAIGFIVNVVLDIILVGFTYMGIAGAAWATGINYLLIFGICLFHFGSRNNNLKWSWKIKKYAKQFLETCKIGFSTSLNTILLAVTLFVINFIMLKSLGNEGIYCWAVSYQIFILLQMLLNGIDTSVFALGGVLVGEDDVSGLYYLYRRCILYLLISVVTLSLLIIIFPEFFGMIFGNRGTDKQHLLPSVLKIFSLFLLPYALVAHVRTIYTVTGRRWLSLSLSVLPFALMILAVYLLAFNHIYGLRVLPADLIWWGFPVSSWLLFIVLLIATWLAHERNKNLRMYNLIPKIEPGPSLNLSVALNAGDVKEVEDRVDDFLNNEKVGSILKSFVSTICKNAMEGILNNFKEEDIKDRYFDLHLRIMNNRINAIFKDDGKRISIHQEDEILSDLNPDDNPSHISTANSFAPYKSFAQFLYLNNQNILKVDILTKTT